MEAEEKEEEEVEKWRRKPHDLDSCVCRDSNKEKMKEMLFYVVPHI